MLSITKKISSKGTIQPKGDIKMPTQHDHIADQKNITIRFAEHQNRHDVIYAAAASPDDKVYFSLCAEIGLAGVFTKLMRYDPVSDRIDELADLEKILHYSEQDLHLRHPHSKIHTAICFAPDGKLLASTHMTAPPVGEDAYHFWHVCNDPERKFPGSHLIIFNPSTGSTEDFGVVVPGGGARWMTYNPERDEVYITGFLRCHFYSANLKTGEVKDHGRISEHDFLGPCWSPADGCVYTSDSQGNFLRFRPDKGTFETLPLGLPDDYWASFNGRGIFNLLPSRDGKKLYGTTWMTHHVFEYDPLKGPFGTMRDLGILGNETVTHDRYPANRFFPRMLIVGNDGKLYLGAYNAQGETLIPPHIFSLDPETLEQEDLGRIEVEGFSPLKIVPSGCCLSDGTLFFGGEKAGGADALAVYLYNRNGVNKKPEAAYRSRYDLAHLPPPLQRPDLTDYYAITPRDNACYVSRGTFIAQEEGMSGTTPLIPRGRGRIGALAQDASSRVLIGVTHGAEPELFVYFPDIRYFLPIRSFGVSGEQCRSIVQIPSGTMFFGTYSEQGGHLYSFDAAANRPFFYNRSAADLGEFIEYFLPPNAQLRKLADHGEIAPGQGISTLTELNGILYGFTYPGGDLFSFDPGTGEKKIHPCFAEHIVRARHIPQILIAHDGKLWFAGHHGHIIAFDPDTETFRETTMKIPCGAGREYLVSMTAATACSNGIFYGGTGADGLLFRMDLTNERIVSLGRPVNEPRIRALAFGHDGVLWGISGLDGDVCHLFRYTQEDGISDEGIMRARMPKTWVVHRADVMLTGNNGEIFIGENDDISHLIVFYPPVSQMKEIE